VNILRRLPLSRLMLLIALVIAIGVSATALAFALGSGPTPPPKPLADAVHDALSAPPVEGVSATVTLTDHLLEGANLASQSGEAGQLSSSPLLSGGSGRLWIAKDGRVRLELQAEKGDTQVLYDGHTLTVYDASSNTLYRYKMPADETAGEIKHTETSADGSSRITSVVRPENAEGADDSTQAELVVKPEGTTHGHEVPSVAKIEEAIAELGQHKVDVSGATPTDVAGQAAYTTRVSPKESGSLFGGAELSWDAVHGVPLRAAIYSSTTATPVIELAANDVSYGPVADSVFEFTPPPNAKIEELTLPDKQHAKHSGVQGADRARPKVTTEGHGVTGVAVLESKVAKSGSGSSKEDGSEELPKVKINGVTAVELPTALGTLLSFERSGVSYVLAGSVTPAAIEAVARGL
jgi:outer membrane lipoprotein-sorting protein